MSDRNLLPPNASQLEIAMGGAASRISNVPVPNRDLYNPDTCPASLLPWLAWALSVDDWDSDASDEEKRAIIKASLYVHKHKGTLAALKSAVAPMGYEISIVEWFNDSPPGPPYTFRLEVNVPDRGITDNVYDQIGRIVDNYKNVRSHMLSLNLAGKSSGVVYMGAACVSGMTTEVYPYFPDAMESTAALYMAAALQSFDTVSVYPAT